jgi:plastocyanin
LPSITGKAAVGPMFVVPMLVLILLLVGVAVTLAMSRGAGGQDQGRAHEILRQSLAAGEIDPDKYRQRAEMLGPEAGTGSSVRRWLPALLAGVAVLLLLGLLFGGAGWSSGGWWGPMGGHMDGMWGQRSSQSLAPDAVDGADEISIEATEMAFDPARFEVTSGEPVNLTVTNAGQVFHDLTIDELELKVEVASGETTTAGLEVDEPGVYEFYCSVPGHASAGMRGTLTVVAS